MLQFDARPACRLNANATLDPRGGLSTKGPPARGSSRRVTSRQSRRAVPAVPAVPMQRRSLSAARRARGAAGGDRRHRGNLGSSGSRGATATNGQGNVHWSRTACPCRPSGPSPRPRHAGRPPVDCRRGYDRTRPDTVHGLRRVAPHRTAKQAQCHGWHGHTCSRPRRKTKESGDFLDRRTK